MPADERPRDRPVPAAGAGFGAVKRPERPGVDRAFRQDHVLVVDHRPEDEKPVELVRVPVDADQRPELESARAVVPADVREDRKEDAVVLRLAAALVRVNRPEHHHDLLAVRQIMDHAAEREDQQIGHARPGMPVEQRKEDRAALRASVAGRARLVQEERIDHLPVQIGAAGAEAERPEPVRLGDFLRLVGAAVVERTDVEFLELGRVAPLEERPERLEAALRFRRRGFGAAERREIDARLVGGRRPGGEKNQPDRQRGRRDCASRRRGRAING